MSCHAVLEYDELRILNQLGHDVTSIGAYINPKNPHVDIRPPLDINYNIDRENKIHHIFQKNYNNGIHIDDCSKILDKDIVDDYDIIIVMHRLDWIRQNWEVFKHKKVILRTIGQNTSKNELEIKPYINNGLNVLRYSPKEREIDEYCGESNVIRFLKYKTDYTKWSPCNSTIISFGQNIPDREFACHGLIIQEIANLLNFKLYGPGNDRYKFSSGMLSYEDQLKELSFNAAYLYTGTYPAQYTLNFIESMLAGIPIVSVGSIPTFPNEVPDILHTIGRNCFNTVPELINELNLLLSNDTFARDVSDMQVKCAYELFSVENNIYKWEEYLNSL